MSANAIVADIGGTNARFCTVDLSQVPAVAGLQFQHKYRCADFADMTALISAYLRDVPQASAAEKFCICVAGAVERDEIYMPNRRWTFSQQAVSAAIGRSIHFINDFTAQVHGIATLQTSEIEWLGEPRPLGNRVFAVVGPGTGLGVGAMTERHEAIPSEGGHSSFSPQNTHQLQLLQMLWQQLPRIEVEHVVSGPGLERLYWANAKLQNREAQLSSIEISKAAKAGDAFAQQVIRDFFDILATYASDVAMVMGAVDGVYIVGDLHVQLRAFNNPERFRDKFNDKENFRPYCSRIPLALVTAQDTGLRGCWRYLELN